MHCPFCKAEDTKVIDSRLTDEGNQVRRRRECIVCNERFSTYETVESVMPRVIKSDESRQEFDEEKLRMSFSKALEKRPVSTDELDQAIFNIRHRVRELGEREITARQIGEWVMQELRNLDEVAYVRYASVYRSFQDVHEFRQEIERLIQPKKSGKKDHDASH